MSRSDRASPGGSTAFSDRWTVRSALVNVPGLLAPGRGGQHDVGELRRSRSGRCPARRGTAAPAPGSRGSAAAPGSDTAGLVALTHSKRDRALLGVAEHLHRVRRRRRSAGSSCGSTFHSRASSAMWASLAQLRKPGRSPSAPHSRVFCAVGWPFICRIPQPGLPSMPRTQVHVVDLARRRRWPGWTGRSPAARSTAAARAVPRISAAARDPRRRDAADLAHPPAGSPRPAPASSSKPTVCAST